MATTAPSEGPPASRRIYANRTLNLRSIQAIGFDMDYTLVHYQVETWEEKAYRRLQDLLAGDGFPVSGLAFPEVCLRYLRLRIEYLSALCPICSGNLLLHLRHRSSL